MLKIASVRWLRWLISHGPYGQEGRGLIRVADIMKGDLVYLRRFVLINLFGRAHVCIHKICRVDDDRDPHDHPWKFKTRVIGGFGYREERYDWQVTKQGGHRIQLPDEVVGRGKWHHRSPEHSHKIVELIGGVPVWTFVIMYKKQQRWGFLTVDGWVQADKYLNNPNVVQDV